MLTHFGTFDNGLLNHFRQIQRELDGAFGLYPDSVDIRPSLRGGYPPVNIASAEDKVDIYLFAGGLESGDFDLSLENNILTIEAERKPEKFEDGRFHLRERVAGKFSRVITLPDDINPEGIKAEYNNGVLHLSIQRREKAKPRQISVQ